MTEASSPPQPTPDTGLIGLVMLARFHSVAADADQLAHDYREAGKPFGIPQILLAAKHLGLKAKLTRTDQSRLAHTPLPALAVDLDGIFYSRPARRRAGIDSGPAHRAPNRSYP